MTGLGLVGRVGLVGLVAISLAACNDTTTNPTGTTTTSITPITSPMTETYSTLVPPRGTASRAFNTHGRGTVTATLTSTTPAGATLGFGVGIPRANGAGCSLATSVVTAAGTSPQVSITADVGEFCVQVYDSGNLTASVAFSVSITHP